jgi:holin-like protein
MTNMHEQLPFGALALTRILPPRSEQIFTPAVAANRRTRRCPWVELPVGFAVLVLSVLAGEQFKIWLHLWIPGNILGLFILLLCFQVRLIEPKFIEKAANRLLFVMPALFIPLFVSAIGWGQLWQRASWVLLAALLAATAGLWIFVGHLAQRLLHRTSSGE